MNRDYLTEAFAIARGEGEHHTRPVELAHVQACVLHIGTLTRSLEMLAKLHEEDMDARDAWADEQEAQTIQKVSA